MGFWRRHWKHLGLNLQFSKLGPEPFWDRICIMKSSWVWNNFFGPIAVSWVGCALCFIPYPSVAAALPLFYKVGSKVLRYKSLGELSLFVQPTIQCEFLAYLNQVSNNLQSSHFYVNKHPNADAKIYRHTNFVRIDLFCPRKHEKFTLKYRTLEQNWRNF